MLSLAQGVLPFLCVVSWAVVDAQFVVYISQHGLHGEIHFLQYNATTVQIRAELETTLQFPDQAWSWGISKFPVDYTEVDSETRCSPEKLGDMIMDFDDSLGYLVLPGNESSTWLKNLSITGAGGIWGKSLVLSNSERRMRVCGTISAVDPSLEHLAEAKFSSNIAGSVYFRWLTQQHRTVEPDTVIYSNLFFVTRLAQASRFKPFTEHEWKIYATDIFQHDHHRSEDNCNFLQQLLDPQGFGDANALGDLNARLGKIRVATNPLNQEQRLLFNDNKLLLLPSDLSIPHRTLYLVIIDPAKAENFIACAPIRHIKPLVFRSLLNVDGVRGDVVFSQRSNFHPTTLNFTVASVTNQSEQNIKYAEEVSSFKVHDLPTERLRGKATDYCSTSGSLFNPRMIDAGNVPPPGFGTQDQYAVGDISGKLQSRNKNSYHNYILPGTSSELNGIYWDLFLPLRGKHSVAHRELVLYRYNRVHVLNITEEIWGCGTILQYMENKIHQKPMFTAQVLFRYPIVGRILFRQPKEEPWQDTTILIEYLIHADGSTQNTSHAHRWAIHLDPPGKDFYNWSDRCLSVGDVLNSHKVSVINTSPEETCKPYFSGLCRLGDLFNRHGSISIAGSRVNAAISRKMFVDDNLPLSGGSQVLGKSLTIFDDFGPTARGERLACALISGYHNRKVVARDWYSNGDIATVKGKVEIVQQSEYEVSNLEIDFKDLADASSYHIHMTPVEANLAFPCEKSSLYETWNPRKVDAKHSPQPGKGSTDQYMMGDLSGKFGNLDGLKEYEAAYNDTNLPLFGYESILGRSIVIHKKDNNRRWACSTLEAGYSPSEARQVSAIASFHHPAGYAYGYIRLRQLIYPDGGTSDTVLEVKLRHPGKNDRNITRNHHFQIFVNPVGVDATVQQTVTRCVAGGYVWNPYYTQLADPLNTDLYRQECGPDNPLRCYVGDVSARTGQIDLGDRRMMLSDSNLPLDGPVTAIGRSIVIFGANGSGERFACANIEYDHDIIKYINLQKPPRFLVAQFMEDVRHVTEAPEWMLNVDARTVQTLHGGACIQMIMHFKGPYAHQLEVDISGLLAAGVLHRPSVYIPGYSNIKRKMALPYRTCEVQDPNEKGSTRVQSGANLSRIEVSLFLFLLVLFNLST